MVSASEVYGRFRASPAWAYAKAHPRLTLAAAALLVIGVRIASPAAEPETVPPEVAKQRQAFVNAILTTASPDAVAAQLQTCTLGEEPGRVSEDRKAGKSYIPDAADICVAVLLRTARDGQFLSFYRSVLTNLGGDASLAGKLPLAVANAVTEGNGKIAIGNGKDTTVPATFAFDAGFTVAWLDRDGRGARKDLGGDAANLRRLTEECLTGDKDPAACFSAGFMQAGVALKGGN